ncbi:MAG TPA: ATPase, T2SS/T4P/T4SS family [Pyrinomonadaceae bacterium]
MTKSDNKGAESHPFNLDENIPGPDFTAYVDSEKFIKELKRVHPLHEKQDYSHPLSFSIGQKTVEKTPPDVGAPTGPRIKARGLACSAYKGRFWSITLRSGEPNKRKPLSGYREQVEEALRTYAASSPPTEIKTRDALGFWPPGYPFLANVISADKNSLPPQHDADREDLSSPPSSSPLEKEAVEEIFLNDIYSLCRELSEILLPEHDSPPGGLIAVTGATDSSKSLITRGLIFLYLQAAAEKAFNTGQRKPHLVTFEDPIEQYYVIPPARHEVADIDNLRYLLNALNLDYTPREKGFDAHNLDEVIKGALRQTPAVLFVGETRDKRDWRDLLEFAGSGHLVITTSHASSVVEAMSRIFRYTRTRTAAQRSEVSRRILGIINIRRLELESQRIDSHDIPAFRALLPAVWKRTTRSVNNLIADGLASLIPELQSHARPRDIGYYSRTYFAEELTKKELLTKELKKHSEQIEAQLKAKAREWDLEGA